MPIPSFTNCFEPAEAVNQAVVEAFGDRVRSADGTIDRKVLGEIVFNDPQARERLNSIVHPAVIQKQKDWLDELSSPIRRPSVSSKRR